MQWTSLFLCGALSLELLHLAHVDWWSADWHGSHQDSYHQGIAFPHVCHHCWSGKCRLFRYGGSGLWRRIVSVCVCVCFGFILWIEICVGFPSSQCCNQLLWKHLHTFFCIWTSPPVQTNSQRWKGRQRYSSVCAIQAVQRSELQCTVTPGAHLVTHTTLH